MKDMGASPGKTCRIFSGEFRSPFFKACRSFEPIPRSLIRLGSKALAGHSFSHSPA